MAELDAFRRYAQLPDPGARLKLNVLLHSTPRTLTIFAAWPKAIFHAILIPRVVPPLTEGKLASIAALLRLRPRTPEDARMVEGVIRGMEEDARTVREMMEAEMEKRFGFKWGIWTGFHAVPSMEHVHLHIISEDLCSEALKTKRHYNSFRPRLGFFIHLNEVLSWFEAVPSFYKTMTRFNRADYEAKLEEPLECFRCGVEFHTMPALKAHLQAEFDQMAEREKAKLEQRERLSKLLQPGGGGGTDGPAPPHAAEN